MPENAPQSSPLLVLDPIDSIQLAASMDGRHGSNRASGNRPQIAADTDIDGIKAWLACFSDTKTTFDNYRKEAERLLLWSTIAMQKPISSLTHEDLLVYQRFLADPQPASRRVMLRGRKVARASGLAAVRGSAGGLQPTTGDRHPEHNVLVAGQCRLPGRQSAIAVAPTRA